MNIVIRTEQKKPKSYYVNLILILFIPVLRLLFSSYSAFTASTYTPEILFNFIASIFYILFSFAPLMANFFYLNKGCQISILILFFIANFLGLFFILDIYLFMGKGWRFYEFFYWVISIPTIILISKCFIPHEVRESYIKMYNRCNHVNTSSIIIIILGISAPLGGLYFSSTILALAINICAIILYIALLILTSRKYFIEFGILILLLLIAILYYVEH